MQAKAQQHRKQMIAGVLVPLAVLLTVRFILNLETARSTVPTSSTQEDAIKEVAGKKSRYFASLDPTVHSSQLERSENARYEGSGRNIFRVDMEANTKRISPAPAPTPDPVEVVQPKVSTSRLRFFGFALIFNSPRKVFLSEGDDIFVGSEGEVVGRRYRIGKIGSNSVEVEDLIEHSVQTLPLAG